MAEECRNNILNDEKIMEPGKIYPVKLGPHEYELILKTTGRPVESRSGSAPKQVFISQCKFCNKLKVEFPDL